MKRSIEKFKIKNNFKNLKFWKKTSIISGITSFFTIFLYYIYQNFSNNEIDSNLLLLPIVSLVIGGIIGYILERN
jgi:uncharacterized membrane protein